MDALAIVSVLAAKIPHPAGLIFAAAITALLCAGINAVTAAVRSEAFEREIAVGGALIAGVLGVIGLLLVALGAPVFK